MKLAFFDTVVQGKIRKILFVIGATSFNILSYVIDFGVHVRLPFPSGCVGAAARIDNFPMI